MLTNAQLHTKKVESTQIGEQLLYQVNGGQDICCTLSQWGKDWSTYNKYSTEPNATTADNRLFAMEFDVEFE